MRSIYFSYLVVTLVIIFFFFFSSRRRHTRSKRDWSSDVCSSDLKTKRDGKTIVKNGEVWQLGVQLSAVSNGYVYKFSNSENILVLVPSQRQSSSLSSFVHDDDGSKRLKID